MAFKHLASARQFQLKLNGEHAIVEYVLESDNVYNLIESVVPTQYRGQGVGHKLAEKTFDYIIAENKRMILTCKFLKRFYEQNRQIYRSYVIE